MFLVLIVLASLFIVYILIVDVLMKKKSQQRRDEFLAMEMKNKVLSELEEKKKGKDKKKEKEQEQSEEEKEDNNETVEEKEEPKEKKEKKTKKEKKENKEDNEEKSVDKESVNEEVNKEVKEEVKKDVNVEKIENDYIRPSVALLNKVAHKGVTQEEVNNNTEAINKVLKSKKVNANVMSVSRGSVYSVYELELRTSPDSVTSLNKELSSALGLKKVSFMMSVPGKNALGLIVPNKKIDKVSLKELLSNVPSEHKKKELLIPVGACPYKKIYTSMYECKHMLVAGVNSTDIHTFLNDVIVSALIRMDSDELELVLIDGKKDELDCYERLCEVAKDNYYDVIEDVTNVISERYDTLKVHYAKNIKDYNERPDVTKLPSVLVVINSYYDVYNSNNKIARLLKDIINRGRNVGVHVLLTVDDSVPEVKKLVNELDIPSLVLFKSNKGFEYKGVKDDNELIGHGEAFVKLVNDNNTYRLQVPFISDEEVKNVIDFIKK